MIRLISEAKFGDNPLLKTENLTNSKYFSHYQDFTVKFVIVGKGKPILVVPSQVPLQYHFISFSIMRKKFKFFLRKHLLMVDPFKRQRHKMANHTHTISRLLPTNCLRVCLTILWSWRLKSYSPLHEHSNRYATISITFLPFINKTNSIVHSFYCYNR